ncbi:hypothetical protein P152DRAFT_99156 [Eremomyces bilateralis CBS 781.70]|uniref:Uncharacterized protein n=1 Tax=Eremomyces bilateralis CBS 781.70 TaxID=1392243 RepID=A0A6G1FX93_9PEZI|nr:uncharacterized protein P152DRAFT_99156 [Eremomyces bilateralis CBS 781.70]KAF1810457.1 hypothetical protein P152DRAFT_99156 [Eremomyces bilateralis CBS 781.70]
MYSNWCNRWRLASHTSSFHSPTLLAFGSRQRVTLLSSRYAQCLNRGLKSSKKDVKRTPVPRRRETAVSRTPPVKEPKGEYGPSIIVYNQGIFKIVLIGCIKVAALANFVYGCFYSAPRCLEQSEDRYEKAVAAMLLGIFPFLFLAKASSPWVAQIRLQLPLAARQNKRALDRFLTRIPADTTLDIVTLRISGLRRTNAVRLSDLRMTKPQRLSMGNMEIIPAARPKPQGIVQTALHLAHEPRNRFQVENETWLRQRSEHREAWTHVLKTITGNSTAALRTSG